MAEQSAPAPGDGVVRQGLLLLFLFHFHWYFHFVAGSRVFSSMAIINEVKAFVY